MVAIACEDNTPNLRTFDAKGKLVIGALVTSSHDDGLEEMARSKKMLLFTRDGSGFMEHTKLSFQDNGSG
jgi:hypothetical protein